MGMTPTVSPRRTQASPGQRLGRADQDGGGQRGDDQVEQQEKRHHVGDEQAGADAEAGWAGRRRR